MTQRTDPKRVAIYLHTLFNGGVERVMFSLSEAMVGRGIQVDLVVNSLDFSPMLEHVPVGVNFVDLGCSGFASRLPRLRQYLHRSRPDCLLSAGHFTNEIAVLGKLFAPRDLRVVVTEHTTLSTELKTLPPRHPRRLAVGPLCHWLYPFADGVVAVSDGVRRDSEQLFGLKPGICRTIYNPVNFPEILRRAQEPVEHPWFRPGESPVLLGIGRLERQKDFLNLLHAFAEVRKHFDARLAILGEGSQRELLTARIAELGLEESVWLAGFVSNPYPYLRHCSAYCLSSQWEGLPIALIEALSLDVPIVATDCPSGPSEILESGKYGTLVPTENSAAFAEGILRILSGHRQVIPPESLDRYRVNSVVDQYLTVLSGLASAS